MQLDTAQTRIEEIGHNADAKAGEGRRSRSRRRGRSCSGCSRKRRELRLEIGQAAAGPFAAPADAAHLGAMKSARNGDRKRLGCRELQPTHRITATHDDECAVVLVCVLLARCDARVAGIESIRSDHGHDAPASERQRHAVQLAQRIRLTRREAARQTRSRATTRERAVSSTRSGGGGGQCQRHEAIQRTTTHSATHVQNDQCG